MFSIRKLATAIAAGALILAAAGAANAATVYNNIPGPLLPGNLPSVGTEAYSTSELGGLVQLGTLPGWVAIVILSRELIVSGLRMVAVAEGVVIAASSWGKVKTVFQIVAIVAFILMGAPIIPATLLPEVRLIAWTIMAAALVLTAVSAVQYFYHARDVIAGPWSPAP